MAITSSDLFKAMDITGTADGDWLKPSKSEQLDRARLTKLLEAADPVESDVDIALALMDLVRDDLTASGTGGGEALTDQDMRLAIRVLSRVAERAGYEFKLPFRDHTSWRAWWNRNGGYGSWQARRELLGGLFDETYARLLAAQDNALDATLVEAISPHRTLGWPEVDAEINELRRQFSKATTPQDCAAVGLVAVRVTEALSRKVYVHALHGAPGEEEPKTSDTKKRLGLYVGAKLRGKGNEELRRLARTTIEAAQAMKHRGTPTRTEVGIAADAVILLANILRRLDE